MSLAYYNELDPFAAAWLRGLVAAGLVAPGDVDERDVRDVQPDDLRGYGQCHFFAGIGGWSYALRLAGWPDDRAVWTGSCPCQPFSDAGKREGFSDARHLWPAWFRLIRECRPPVVFGEQVASAAGLGWFDVVSTDLETEAYSIGAADLCAAGVGAPHIRQRLWFVADRPSPGLEVVGFEQARRERETAERGRTPGVMADSAEPRPARSALAGAASGATGADAGAGHQPAWRVEPEREGAPPGLLADAAGGGRGVERAPAEAEGGSRATEHDPIGELSGGSQGPGPRSRRLADADGAGAARHAGEEGSAGKSLRTKPARGGEVGSWSDLVWLPCRDGKARPTKPGLFPLAHGIPGRVGLLRGAGNAIVPQVAAEFINAYREARQAINDKGDM